MTAKQMKHLFGTGSHPLTDEPLRAACKIYDNTGIDGFNAEVAKRVRDTGESRPPHDVRARVRSEVAQRFVADHGRAEEVRELSDALARYARPRQTAVAGVDLTFSPVMSVPALWAVAPPYVARVIEAAHDAAVRDALAVIERQALFTGEGATVPGRSRPVGWLPRRSPTVTPGPETPTCTPTSRSPTRCRPGRASGCRSTARRCSSTRRVQLVDTTPRWSGSWSRRSGECVERPGASTGSPAGDRTRPVRESSGVPAALSERWSERRTATGKADAVVRLPREQ